MNKFRVLALLFTIGFFSCKSSTEEIDKIEIAKQYYKALDNSNGTAIKPLLSDSLITKVPEYDYKQTFYQEEYIEKWLKWDSVFDPSYQIITIEEKNGVIKAKISKIDKRIFFLQQKPFLTDEVLRFKNDKIVAIETEYLNFNDSIWERNKNELLSWINENHPQLSGFIYDQTKTGAIKFLEAIELYKNQK